MTVAASKVKAVCTDSEVELVRASRKPTLHDHSHGELKKLAARARKLFDKWQGQSRSQSRTKRRQAGKAETAANTELKTTIFREALDAFEARLTKLVQAGKAATSGKEAKSAKVTKKSRAAENRQSRAALRTGMTAALDLENQSRSKSKPVAAKSAPKKASAKKAATKAVKKPGPASKAAAKITSKRPGPSKPAAAGKQLRASVVAKEKRLKQTGKTTRVLGHVSARGKRDQARRDSKN